MTIRNVNGVGGSYYFTITLHLTTFFPHFIVIVAFPFFLADIKTSIKFPINSDTLFLSPHKTPSQHIYL